ncbi:hypothetical protein FRC03_006830, partial [Tulasnella sp. 419]
YRQAIIGFYFFIVSSYRFLRDCEAAIRKPPFGNHEQLQWTAIICTAMSSYYIAMVCYMLRQEPATKKAFWGTYDLVVMNYKLVREADIIKTAIPPSYPKFLFRRAAELQSKFQGPRGSLKDLAWAIVIYRTLLDLPVSLHTGLEHFVIVKNLANCYRVRYEKYGIHWDLQNSIKHYEAVVRLLPPGHPLWPYYCNTLAELKMTKYLESSRWVFLFWKGHQDVNDAISLYTRSLPLLPQDDPQRIRSLFSLAHAFIERFRGRGDVRDLGRAFKCYDEALQQIPEDHPEQESIHAQVGEALGILLAFLSEQERSLSRPCTRISTHFVPSLTRAAVAFL